MTDSTNFRPLGPEELLEQATHIVMNRFDLEAPQASGMLRIMSEHDMTQMRRSPRR